MSPSEYEQLVGFLGERFAAVDQRFAALDQRFDSLETGVDGRFREVFGHFDHVYRKLERLEHEYVMVTAALKRLERGR